MNEFKKCIRCKSSDIQLDCEPDIGQFFRLNDRVNVVVYCENCGIQTTTYASDSMGSIRNAVEAAIEDWNTDY